MNVKDNRKVATLGAGCFWCVEAVFDQLKGVELVESGYIGGHVDNPTYKDICTGASGHAEVAQITYNTSIISFKELLEVFWKTHDPTTLNAQGADRGTQYRSVIYYNTEQEKEEAELYKKRLNESGAFDNPVITEVTAAPVFYKAENYHQNYYENNKLEPYCRFVIEPKIGKFKEAFAEKLKE